MNMGSTIKEIQKIAKLTKKFERKIKALRVNSIS